MADLLDIISQAGRSARDLAMIKAGLLRQNAEQNAAPMARGVEEGLIGEGVDMARAGMGALGDAYGAGDGALEKLLSGYHDRMAKARARAAALRAQSPEAFAYGEKLPERLADAAGVLGVAGHARLPEFPRIGPGAAPELAFARAGGEAPAVRMPAAERVPVSRAGEPIDFEQVAYHGSPHDFDTPDIAKIGSGEGTQMEGWGIYSSKSPKAAEWYRSVLERVNERPGQGSIHKWEIPDDNQLLDWNKPLAEQPPAVKAALEKAGIVKGENVQALGMDTANIRGKDLYGWLSKERFGGDGGPKKTSEYLNSIGINGLKYRDRMNYLKGTPGGTDNFVIWDQPSIKPIKKAKTLDELEWEFEMEAP